MLLMVLHHGGIVHLIDMVTGEDDHIVGVVPVDKVDVLVNGVGRALVPAALLVVALIRGQNLGAGMGLVQVPGLAVADVFIQLQGLILGQDAHGINAGVDAVGQRKINNAVFAAEGNGGLRGLFRQDLESAALATGQKHGDAAFFLKIHGHSSSYCHLKIQRENGRRLVKKSYFLPRITYHTFSDSESDILPKIFSILWASFLKSLHAIGGFLGISTESSRFSNQSTSSHRPNFSPHFTISAHFS